MHNNHGERVNQGVYVYQINLHSDEEDEIINGTLILVK